MRQIVFALKLVRALVGFLCWGCNISQGRQADSIRIRFFTPLRPSSNQEEFMEMSSRIVE